MKINCECGKEYNNEVKMKYREYTNNCGSYIFNLKKARKAGQYFNNYRTCSSCFYCESDVVYKHGGKSYISCSESITMSEWDVTLQNMVRLRDDVEKECPYRHDKINRIGVHHGRL